MRSFERTWRASLSRRAITSLMSTTLLVACVSLPAPAPSAGRKRPDVLIKFATLAPEGSAWMKSMRALDADVRESTQGRLGFKFYTGGVQGDEKEVLRKIRNGQLNGGGFTGYGLGSVAGDVRVLELPFMFHSPEEIDHVRTEMDSTIGVMFERKGMVLLGWADVGFVYIFSKEPIRTPEDLKERKVWIWSGDPLAEMFFSAFDVSPIPLSVPDVLTSLQMGMIDVVYASPLACVAVQWYTRVRYMTDLPITYSIGAVLVSKRSLEGVSEHDRETLRTKAARYLAELNKKTRRQNREAVDLMKSEGISLVGVEEASAAAFASRSEKAWPRGVGKLYSQELLEMVVSLVQEYRARPRGAERHDMLERSDPAGTDGP